MRQINANDQDFKGNIIFENTNKLNEESARLSISPLLAMLSQVDKTGSKESTLIDDCCKLIDKLNEAQWQFKSYHPLISFWNKNNPAMIYFGRQMNNQNRLVSIDLSQVGIIYSMLQEIWFDHIDNRKNPILIAIKGF